MQICNVTRVNFIVIVVLNNYNNKQEQQLTAWRKTKIQHEQGTKGFDEYHNYITNVWSKSKIQHKQE